jgi:hypothetical protein
VGKPAVRKGLYEGAIDIIRGSVERAESGEITREGAWRTIKDVLREVERHGPREQPDKQD